MLNAIAADYIYTGNTDPIKDGIVEYDENGQILYVGQKSEQEKKDIQKLKGIVCPGFVNTHCHLELSHLRTKLQRKTGLHSFIVNLQQTRNVSHSLVLHAMKKAEETMVKNGVVAVGDISNSNVSFNTKNSSEIYYHTFIELFGFDFSNADAFYRRGTELLEELGVYHLPGNLTPHSPYSVSDALMEKISSSSSGQPLSVHNQETEEENRMFLSGKGKIVDMLKSFKLDLSEWKHSKTTSIKSYLPKLPQHNNLLLVHNTFTSKDDIIWAENIHQKLFWCFCPKANLYIEGVLPPIDVFYQLGVSCTLGTDSLASNDTLCVLEEMKTIQKEFPQIPLQELIKWSTWNGARFLGIEAKYGSIEVGKQPGILHIDVAGNGNLEGARVKRLV